MRPAPEARNELAQGGTGVPNKPDFGLLGWMSPGEPIPDEGAPAGAAQKEFGSFIILAMPRDPKQRDGVNEYEKKFLRIIDELGWHVTNVAPLAGEEGNLWSYSTGLLADLSWR